MNERTSTIIVDDHAAFRDALREFVQSIPNLEVVGEAVDGQDALEMMTSLEPQLVLMDICMPRMSGTESCRLMKRTNAALPVVLYSANSLEIELAVADGVADLCLGKECLFDDLPAWIGNRYSHSIAQTFGSVRTNSARSQNLDLDSRARPKNQPT